MRALVVEDDPSIAFVEQKALELDGFDVTIATTGTHALVVERGWHPDILILDHYLPDMDGLDVLREIRQTSRVAIIVVTARADEAARVESLEAGADDYVVKPFSTPELMARVHAVLRRMPDLKQDEAPLEFLGIRIDDRTRRVFEHDREIQLTRIEYHILRMLVRGAGAAVSREDLAREIWALPAERIGKSLDVHVSVLRRKLGDDSKKPSYIQTVRSFGFRLAAN